VTGSRKRLTQSEHCNVVHKLCKEARISVVAAFSSCSNDWITVFERVFVLFEHASVGSSGAAGIVVAEEESSTRQSNEWMIPLSKQNDAYGDCSTMR
jgi:hypothetical protein